MELSVTKSINFALNYIGKAPTIDFEIETLAGFETFVFDYYCFHAVMLAIKIIISCEILKS